MESGEKFCLRWNDFESNISAAFKELRNDNDFYDITIACENEQVQAHKVILGACSVFFKSLLKKNKHDHPLVYLSGVKFSYLSSVLDFMYYGEVNVAQEELNSFLAVAEDLQIKGLSQTRSEVSKPIQKRNSIAPRQNERVEENHNRKEDEPPVAKKAKVAETASNNTDDDDIQEVHPIVKPEPESNVENGNNVDNSMVATENLYDVPASSHSHSLVDNEAYHDDDFGEYEGFGDEGFDGSMLEQMQNDGNKDTILDTLIENITVRKRHPVHGVVHECTVCKKVLKKKNKMKSHAEIHLKGFRHQCTYCGKYYKTRPSLKVHISTSHKLEKEQQEPNYESNIIEVDMESILGLRH